LIVEFDHRLFNPVYWHIEEAFSNPDIRNVLIYGGSSAAKTYSLSQNLVYNSIHQNNSTLVFRKESTSIDDSVYADFKSIALSVDEDAEEDGGGKFFKIQDRKIITPNGKFRFRGLDDSEKVKGISQYNKVYLNELSKFDLTDWEEIQRRMRGRPHLQIVADWNPISETHWIKTELIDKDEWIDLPTEIKGNKLSKLDENSFKRINKAGDTILIKVTYKDNYWVVGSPCGKYGFYDKHTIKNFERLKRKNNEEYDVYALGEWGVIRTGGEYLHSFRKSDHVKKATFNPLYPIHISVDNNVLPYISVTFYQAIENELRQVHEICAEDPLNTVTKAGQAAKKHLEDIGYNDIVYLYGDASTKAGNTIDDEKRSFLDKFKEQIESGYIVEDRVPKSNPSVSMSGEFVNSILAGNEEGLSIVIDESCKKSITDYESVKKDVNGGILKVRIKDKSTQQTYEPFGHLTDTLRYVVVKVFEKEYTIFSNRRKRNSHKEEDMLYFNSQTKIDYKSKIVFVMPDCNGKMIIIRVRVHDFVDVLSVTFSDIYSEDVIFESLKDKPNDCIFECVNSYFPLIRSLREKGHDIRGMKETTKLHQRISANENLVKTKFRFRDDYDTDPEYVSFMNNMLDYNGKDNYEALNILSLASYYINRSYLNN